ncbi:Do family serine endopeptidase [Calycomorphotria hydatis]|uniref:Putative periplasmic serine endoprotease DegP-like n=1 Tax=Calycomorphotria hydatis TaxID=2528027 RepID=A0A517T7E6_9PLAN|nr:Do family serine endopeptidase [Calycomorphotria hydatis]QDT64296.1 putative periplasmic serine endoprotease DegP-like precursor [Calycomorphotria hydatis]
MSMVKQSWNWVGGVIVGAVIAGAIGVFAQQTQTGPQLFRSDEARKGVVDARGLSAAFNDISAAVTPAIVSIEARGRARTVQVEQGEQEIPEFENLPFGRGFGLGPDMGDLMEQLRRQRQFQRFSPPKSAKGSGFIVDAENGIVMTNNHVVNGADEVIVKLYDGREFTATDIKTDPRTDVAVLRIPADNLTEVPLGNSDNTQIGDWVLAFGSPFGLDLSVTAGIVSAKGRGPGINEREDYIQTDAAINPGNSGGPLVDLSGHVIGINTAISSRSGGYDGIGFTIPVNMAQWVANQLLDRGEVQRAFLGVGIQALNGDLANQFNINTTRGAVITRVYSDTPAEEAGLKVGDVIVTLNGKEVTGSRKLQIIVEQLLIGKSYDAEIVRDGKHVTVPITFRELPSDFGKVAGADAEDSDSGSSDEELNSETYESIGLEASELTSDVVSQLGYEEGTTGVVITDVKQGTPAQFAGLRTGMLIKMVGHDSIESMDDLRTAMKSVDAEKGVLLLVGTPRGNQFITLRAE